MERLNENHWLGIAAIKSVEQLVYLKRRSGDGHLEFKRSCQRMINQLVKEFPDFIPHYEDID